MNRWWHLENKAAAMTPAQKYIISVVAAVSRLASAVAGGDYKDSLCKRAGKAAAHHDGFCRRTLVPVLDALFMEPGHCAKATLNPKGDGDYTTWHWGG